MIAKRMWIVTNPRPSSACGRTAADMAQNAETLRAEAKQARAAGMLWP